MKYLKIVIGALIVIGISVGLSVLFDRGIVPVPTASPTETPVGALSGPILPYNYFGFGGLVLTGGKMDLKTSTGTPCRIQAPAATSTLIYASLNVKTSTSTALMWQIAKTTNVSSYATTTNLGWMALDAAAGGTMIASSSPAAGDAAVFTPNDWLIVGVSGATGVTLRSGWTGFAPVGSCRALWLVTSN